MDNEGVRNKSDNRQSWCQELNPLLPRYEASMFATNTAQLLKQDSENCMLRVQRYWKTHKIVYLSLWFNSHAESM
jgi:hypothetical protein